MALATPILQSISAFDSTTAKVVQFQVTSGDQVVKNRLTIRLNSTNEIVYQNTVETFEFAHTIPASTLANGEYYNCYINTYNANDAISGNSNVVQFYCLSAPILSFTNIVAGETINSGSYNFILNYSQSQGELLNELFLYLYDSNNNLIQTSNLITSQFVPPLILNYTFTGLEDSQTYYVQARATTLHNMVVETSKINFNVLYNYQGSLFQIGLQNICDSGYVEVKSQLVLINGKNDGGVFHNSTVILQDDANAEWSEGFRFNSNKFIKSKWWSPILRGQTNVMSSEDGNSRIEIEYKRGIPQGANEPRDYLEVRGYKDNILYFKKYSSNLPIQNNNSMLMSWVKINGNTFDIQLIRIDVNGALLEWNNDSNVYWDYISRLEWNSNDPTPTIDTSNVIVWNDGSNVEYNRITDLYFNNNQLTEPTIENDEFINDVEPYRITDVKLTNSVVDHFNVTIDVDEEFSTDIPTWTYGTVMDATMSGNLSAGNVNRTLEIINNIKIKRREANTLEWITLVNHPVSTIEDLSFSIKDYFIPSGKNFEYALVPCWNDTEYEYFTSNVTTLFNGIFVSDLDKSMRLFSGVMYSQDNYTQDIGILKPFNKIYPTVIHNSKTNFRSLTVTGDILDSHNKFDANEINNIKNQWITFLTDGKPKFITNWNGDIILGVLTTPPSFTYKNNCGLVIPQLSFTFTEQGQWNNQQDLINNGYLKGDEDL